MSKTFETGHAKNVSNFAELITCCIAYGVTFNPGNLGIRLTALNQKKAAAEAAMNSFSNIHQTWTLAVDARQAVFEVLPKRITRVLNAVKSSGLSQRFFEDVTSITRKLTGKRATNPRQLHRLIPMPLHKTVL